MSLRSRSETFLKRHRKSIVVGAVTGVIVAGIIKAKRALDETILKLDESHRQQTEKKRYRTHLVRIQRECDEALLRFVPPLSNSVDATFAEIPQMFSELRRTRSSRKSGESDSSSAPSGETDLWDKIKVAVFTRIVVGLYAFNLVHLCLRLQLHILGRCHLQNSSLNEDFLSLDDRGSFLSLTYNHILGDGLRSLASEVARASSLVLSEVPFNKRLDCLTTGAIIRRIRDLVETSPIENQTHPLATHIVVPTHRQKDVSTFAQSLLDETWDCVESVPFKRALTAALESSCTILEQQLSENIFNVADKNHPKGTLQQAQLEEQNVRPLGSSKPLPSLLVMLKPSKTIFAMSSNGHRSIHADTAASLGDVQSLCDAIFSSAPSSD